MSKIYYGIGSTPKNMIRATAEQAIEHKQARYWGIKKIDPELLKKKPTKTNSLIKEQLKYRKLQDDAKILLNNIKKTNILLQQDLSQTKLKKYQKTKDSLMKKKVNLLKKIQAQGLIVNKQ